MTQREELWFDIRRFSNGNRLNITGYVGINETKRERVRGQLTRLPGSPTIWVSHGLFVPEKYRGKGYSQAYNAFMLHQAWVKLGASAVIASVKYDNDVQRNRLERLQWTQISNALFMVKPSPLEDDDSSSTLYDFYPPLNQNPDSPWIRTVTWSK